MNNIIDKFEFEVNVKCVKDDTVNTDEDIVLKYENGDSRVVTEIGSYKVALIKNIFCKESNYNLHPDYQRRITWNDAKRSKLIESLIINIPIPPIFLYEYEYDKYEVMDGLQRLSAIIDFYNDKYKLTGLEEWSELNHKKYSDLPQKIKEGIGRRQIQFITLLKESAKTPERADKIRRLVFERLNTGGVKLLGQEIRNAIFNGPANKLCIELSENTTFRKLWEIPNPDDPELLQLDLDDISIEIQNVYDEKVLKKLEKHSLYKRMYDVELVLRFFAMRHLDEFNYSLSDFLDDVLISMNKYSPDDLSKMKSVFEKTIEKAYSLFGDYAFKYFDGNKWSSPTKMIYDPMMLALTNYSIPKSINVENNKEKLKKFYISCLEFEIFDGKHQSKDDINTRANKIKEFLTGISDERNNTGIL